MIINSNFKRRSHTGQSWERSAHDIICGTFLSCGPEKAVITFKGTIGGFGLVADSNFDSDLELSFGYRVQKNVYAYLG
jgi:hypothetical protein